ncbi:MAG: hypothetical protein ABW085_00125 [Sedimenticola sp.]
MSEVGRRILPVVLLLVLTGCASRGGFLPPSGEPLAGLPEAHLPRVDVGDKLYFSNGRREWVVGFSDDKVQWRRTGQRSYTRSKNFLIPDIAWDNRTRKGVHLMDIEKDILWPLQAGNSASFSVRMSYLNKENGSQRMYDRQWRCEVDGVERLSVYAGTFDTYRIVCERYSLKGNLSQRRIWHYAPEIEQFISRWDDYPGRRIAYLELTAYQPYVNGMDKRWKRSYWKHLRRAMERYPSGEKLNWYDKESDTLVSITPVRTVKSADGKFCRNYRLNITLKGEARNGAGMVCRDRKGYWKIPKSIWQDSGIRL